MNRDEQGALNIPVGEMNKNLIEKTDPAFKEEFQRIIDDEYRESLEASDELIVKGQFHDAHEILEEVLSLPITPEQKGRALARIKRIHEQLFCRPHKSSLVRHLRLIG